MKEPLISVIVPIYNVENYLHKCVDSIIAQTYTNLEIILVDDGSPDNCPKVCDEYAEKDNRVQVIHKENGGLSSARNSGIDIAKGRYITFIDSDDWVDCNHIENLYSHIVDSDISVIDNRYQRKTIYNKLDFMEYFVKTLNNSANGKLYKKSIISSERFEIGKVHGEDYDFNSRVILNASKIVVFGTKSYHYVKRVGSITHSKFNTHDFDAVYFKDKVLKLLCERKEFNGCVKYARKHCFMTRLLILQQIKAKHLVNDYKSIYKDYYDYLKFNYKTVKPYLTWKQKVRYYGFLIGV